MAKYIDKSILEEEIRRQISAIDDCPKLTNTQIAVLEGDKVILTKLLSFLDTLEVKEVDLEKEFDDYIEKQNAFTSNDNSEIKYYNGDSFNHVYDIYPIAKHFFELGLKAQGRK